MDAHCNLTAKKLLKVAQDKIKESLQLLDGNDDYWYEVKEVKNPWINDMEVSVSIYEEKQNNLWK